jgi:topoisomerase IV subunit A
MGTEELDNIVPVEDDDNINNSSDNDNMLELDQEKTPESGRQYDPTIGISRLSGLYQDWFLDYASYVILERAVPHIDDGLKPVQRRILHSMKRLDDGRYNKVANIIGHTMQFHPHGDASIGDALVQLGQKEILIDMQGNWGNIFTGDSAAAPRYIEARLSKFALDVVFNPKTTEWQASYDGRNKEPVTLPVKFPLLLAQGVEGIAVGLASKILPHNFNELIDASIKYLKGQDFELFPDFPTGGLADCSKYNDGIRGGSVRIRARIEKLDSKTLVIRDIPFGRNTSSLIETIIKANDKGKIKLKKIEDNTAEKVEIQIQLAPGISPDTTIDALYAFTDCEVSVSPNNCVIFDDKPNFISSSDILKRNTDHTLGLLKQELQIQLEELEESWHQCSLEKIFIMHEIYEGIKECKTEEAILDAINEGLKPYVKMLRKPVVQDDLIRLSNIPIKRISKYSSFKADEQIKGIEREMAEVKNNLADIVNYTINYFKEIRKKYGDGYPRMTELRSFDTISATQVVVRNEKLYVNREEGFIGTSLKKDECVGDCSDIDDIITFKEDGTYQINKIAPKVFVGKNIIHAAVFKKNDDRTIYNIIYRDGLNGYIMMKRCPISGLTRDKVYFITKGTPNSKILYFSANENGEAEVVRVFLKPKARLKKPVFDFNFAELAIKGKSSMGNVLTKYAIHKIVIQQKGESTLGGLKIWFDADIKRLNTDTRGTYLGEFHNGDKLLVVTKSGNYRLSNYELTNHYEDDLLLLEKFKEGKIFSAVYYDAEQSYFYLKRFSFDPTEKLTNFISENEKSELVLLSTEKYPQFVIEFGGKHKNREKETINGDEFITVKGFKAKGKRLSSYTIKAVVEIEPLVKEEEAEIDEIIDEIPENTITPEPDFTKDEGGAEQMTLDL